MAGKLQFALNHMCAPEMSIDAFFALAASLGVGSVEIRNDLPGNAILDGTPPLRVREEAAAQGLHIASINALQRFNDWNEERRREAVELIDLAAACGARALVLVPTNDGSGRADGERQAKLRIALEELSPLLKEAGITGLVEPLGFETSSLRFKSEAVEAIRSVDSSGTFALLHDTFHHYVAGEQAVFPEITRLVHVSGVADPALAPSDLRDSHRGLVDLFDRLGNVEQILLLLQGGYAGVVSFEPFAASVHALPDIAGALRRSMDFISSELGRKAA